jgi:hypothetical protein
VQVAARMAGDEVRHQVLLRLACHFRGLVEFLGEALEVVGVRLLPCNL